MILKLCLLKMLFPNSVLIFFFITKFQLVLFWPTFGHVYWTAVILKFGLSDEVIVTSYTHVCTYFSMYGKKTSIAAAIPW